MSDSVTKFIQRLTDEEIDLAVQEISELHDTGVLPDGCVKAVRIGLEREYNVPSMQTLKIAESEILFEAARRFSRLRKKAQSDAEHYRATASYLASCHAATAEHLGFLKSTSHLSKVRLIEICRKAAECLEGKFSWAGRRSEPSHSTVDRCKTVVKELEEQLDAS